MTLKNLWCENKNEGFFRKKLYINKISKIAVARIFCDTGYELFINGRFVAGLDEWNNNRDYNVTVFLKEGYNVIAVHGLNHSGHRGFCFELTVDGKSVVKTDETWKCSPIEKFGWQLEEYNDEYWVAPNVLDTSLAGPLQWWTTPGDDIYKIVPTFDNCQFFIGDIPKGCDSPYFNKKADVVKIDKRIEKVLGANYVKHVKSKLLPDILEGANILECTGDLVNDTVIVNKTERYTGVSFVLDFGIQTVGFLRLKLKSENSFSFRVRYGENIDEACNETSRDTDTHKILNEEYHVFGGEREFECRRRHEFRFVYLEFFDSVSTITVSDFSVRSALYPFNRIGYFSCDDKDMTKLWFMGERTLGYCMQEYYLDSPKRDRLLWTGDLRLEALVNYYTFGDLDLVKYCLNELKKCQKPDGAIPSSLGVGLSNLLDYVALYVICINDLHLYGDDKEILNYKESIEKATDYLTSLTNEFNIIDVPKNPLGNLWMVELNGFTGLDPYLNTLYLRSLKTAKLVNELAGDNANVVKYNLLIEKVTPLVENLTRNDNLIGIFDNTIHTQLQYELAEYELNNGNVNKMMERIRKYWGVMLTSGADCLHEGTETIGAFKKVDKHYTTVPYNVSDCHGWTAAATILFPMGIAGVKPVKSGFSEVVIKPSLDTFKRFKCAVPTPHGIIAVKYNNGEFWWVVPKKIKTTIIINDMVIINKNSGSYKV